jgi:hypothetical protein
MSDAILIAYDGSEDARAAVHEAGRLFAGRDAEVLTSSHPRQRQRGAHCALLTPGVGCARAARRT